MCEFAVQQCSLRPAPSRDSTLLPREASRHGRSCSLRDTNAHLHSPWGNHRAWFSQLEANYSCSFCLSGLLRRVCNSGCCISVSLAHAAFWITWYLCHLQNSTKAAALWRKLWRPKSQHLPELSRDMICKQHFSVSLPLSYKAVEKNTHGTTSIMINYRGNASKRKT